MWDSANVVELETNPIRVLRKARHLSIGDVAEQACVNYQTVYLNECGVFPSVVPKIRAFLIEKLDGVGSQIDTDYRRFVLDKRRIFAIEYADKLESLPDPDLRFHPFAEFRSYISEQFESRSKFAKTICVEPAGLYRLERPPYLHEMPGRLREALLQVGVSSDNVQELNERINEFFSRS